MKCNLFMCSLVLKGDSRHNQESPSTSLTRPGQPGASERPAPPALP
jgi:hypothetical protein